MVTQFDHRRRLRSNIAFAPAPTPPPRAWAANRASGPQGRPAGRRGWAGRQHTTSTATQVHDSTHERGHTRRVVAQQRAKGGGGTPRPTCSRRSRHRRARGSRFFFAAPPEHLLSYDPPITDAYEWEAGFEEWLDARSRWAERHGIDV